ncbi:MAG TPA: AAA family ATPase [Geminicoccus sp.]|jgi:RecA-family ATPase|uniref:AAA family ATPase n=1 Tax=Geminicoccus sp. TaxID=2024832 RepID=UPI002E31775A|nr:AAA family ATPase [Geminicoccus sp.]HEX2528480.1 AAA family ATPase [Geminicoccus sp.]
MSEGYWQQLDEGEEAFLRGELPPKREPPKPELLSLIDAADLDGLDPPPREWLVDGFLATKTVALFTGKGGAGKSRLALQLGEMVRRGHPFLGMKTQPCTVLIYSCEDDGDELHRRRAQMQRSLGIHIQPPGRLLFAPRVGASNALMALDARTGISSMTPAFATLRATAIETGARLVIIDTVAQTFPGSENDRAQVTAYVNLLAGLALELNGCVLLLAHPPKNEAEYSGSTGWDGTVRARILLHEKDDDGLTRRYLKLAKSNYSPKFEHEIIVDDYGVSHLAEHPPTSMAEKIGAYQDLARYKTIFLSALDILTRQGRAVSHSSRAPNFAPKVIIRADLGLGCSVKQLAAAMEALFKSGIIVAGAVVGKGSDRKAIYGIARAVPKGPADQDTAEAERDEVADSKVVDLNSFRPPPL